MLFFDDIACICSYTLVTFPAFTLVVTLTERICHGRGGDAVSGGVEQGCSATWNEFVILRTDTLRSRRHVCLFEVCRQSSIVCYVSR